MAKNKQGTVCFQANIEGIAGIKNHAGQYIIFYCSGKLGAIKSICDKGVLPSATFAADALYESDNDGPPPLESFTEEESEGDVYDLVPVVPRRA